MRRLKAATAVGRIDTPAPASRNLVGCAIATVARRVRRRFLDERPRLLPCVWSVGFVAVITLIGELTSEPYVKPMHLSLMYLLAVFVAAIRFGLWPALLGALLSVAALDYLFIPPLYSFETDTPQDALLLVFLSVGAVVASGIAGRLREQVGIAERNAETTSALYRFAGKLAGTVTLDATVAAVVDQVGAMLPHRAAIALNNETRTSAPLTFPLHSSGETVGSLEVTPLDDAETSEEQHRLLVALAELAGIAIGRQILADRLAQLGIEQAADRLRSALLNSIAHDLTAPIASVATALTSLAENYNALDDTPRRDLILDAEREAKRLHQFSANLIHIARLEAGVMELRRVPTDISELIDSALMSAHVALGSRGIETEIPMGLPPVHIDPVLVEQALFHILENAGKYAPPDTAITISAEPAPQGVILRIADEGPGFAPEDRERIFTKFYRADQVAGISGTGIGLAICRGFIEANGGTVTADNRPDRSGAVFTITLPARDGPEEMVSSTDNQRTHRRHCPANG
jgi:two-component system, OmpR family, sensor histidine kinase KdpD